MNRHLALRVAGLTVCVVGIASYPSAETNLDWVAALLIAAAVGPIQFLWLLGQRALADEQWSRAISWREPFLPMSRHPFRFWLFIGQCAALGGFLSMVIVASGAEGKLPYGATFFLLGIAFMVASSSAFSRRSVHG